MNKEQKALAIKIMLKKKGITQRALAQKIGEHPQTISNRLNGDRPLDTNFIMRLQPVLGDEVLELMGDPDKSIWEHESTRPRIPYDVTAGSLTEVMQGVTAAECEQVPLIPVFPRYDFTMRITGDSMQPYLHPGDEVACLRVNEATFLQWGRIHVLDTSQGVVIKKIYDDEKGVRCVSLNDDYPPFVIPKEDIYSYNLVVGLLRI